VFCRRIGVILHQPLNPTIFRKNGKKRPKMNGPPVSPCQKTENAPTWRPRKHIFWPHFCPTLPVFFGLLIPISSIPTQYPNCQLSLIYILTPSNKGLQIKSKLSKGINYNPESKLKSKSYITYLYWHPIDCVWYKW